MIVPITNTPRDYAWGSTTAIAELLGREPSGRPEAELWLGDHPGSPARVVGTGESLADVETAPLPFLLKVLAADAPLSLQAHPTSAQAEEGFAREEAAGIPIDAPERNYKDRFHKPEMIYALSDPFRALCGFRPVAETRVLLEPVADDPRIAGLLARLVDDDSLRATVEWIVGGGPEIDDLVDALVEASSVDDALTWEVVRRLSETSPGDPGIAVSVLLHAVDLRPGEALYLPAGNIHAYVRGLGVELMAASDNVLRGGLTPKHVDVPELLRVLDFAPQPVPYMSPDIPTSGEQIFQPPVDDFRLTVIRTPALRDGVDLELPGPAIVLVVDGVVDVSGVQVRAGGAVYLEGESPLAIEGSGSCFVASAGTSPRPR